jgi:D-tyrosyl-tRNA(Tyr) deacylase
LGERIVRALVQRVSSARVTVAGRLTGEIGPGLLILICAMRGDTEAEADQLAAKIVKLRIFRDAADKMNLSLRDTGGAALVVSQFTLAADTARGNRPGFSTAAAPDEGERLYRYFSDHLRGEGVTVENGEFGADMDVALVNQGPVTIWLDTAG